MRRNLLLLGLFTAALAAGELRILGSPSINGIGLLPDSVPPAGSGLGGVANCTSSGLNALSADGQIAVGFVHGDTYWDGVVWETGVDIPVYWSKTTGLVRRNDDWRHGHWTGIGSGVGTPGPNYTAAMAGNIDGIGRYSWPTVNQDPVWPIVNVLPLGPVSDNFVAAQNSVSGTNRYIAGEHTKSNSALRWDTNDLANPVYVQGSGKTWFTAVANDGACVGTDRHGVGATTKGPIYWTESGGIQDIPPLASNATTSGEGRGISDNGAYVTGMIYTDGGTPLYTAFRWSPGETASTALAPAGTDTLCWATDAADNGTVVGGSYDPTEGYRACVWDTIGQPHLLRDLLVTAGVNLGGWTTLTMAHSITPDAKYIAGYGTATGGIVEGFVAEIGPIAIPSPLMTIRASGPNIVISWPTNAAAYALQQNTNLATTGWTAVTDVPVVADTNLQVTLPTSAARQFYRLQK